VVSTNPNFIYHHIEMNICNNSQKTETRSETTQSVDSPNRGKGALPTYIKLFLTGFVQVLFVAMNTYFITKLYYYGIFICGFAISLIWTYNVKRVVFGTNLDRFYYAAGAALGSLAGVLLSVAFLKLHIN
jgi:hypothetical protein